MKAWTIGYASKWSHWFYFSELNQEPKTFTFMMDCNIKTLALPVSKHAMTSHFCRWPNLRLHGKEQDGVKFE